MPISNSFRIDQLFVLHFHPLWPSSRFLLYSKAMLIKFGNKALDPLRFKHPLLQISNLLQQVEVL